ncbi:MAG: cell division ATP-binding protein FtsE [Candidatus Tagabacteria bacterium RIFCSPLOWO2_01_FULL_42_9]|uniref:Cell division ATP-binding protein FtsE n=1 Tax=Candidatus Tagabacteria bacterium RIFCSPLOWO2_01_FULL_42_9 TaxID=1802296 RepID=A0A1G2LWC1_9BACT|nr:MAG: cell division ATP-binding protein FtsE [Candidatus Tagabacteria bacterium RIFCSPLOWO2_01_FULL_42_9]
MVYFEKVTKIYSPTSTALEDVNFSIEPQEFISLVGQSGSGKTTLLKLLLAEEKPTSGKVFFESQDVHSLSKSELPHLRRRIGCVFQEFRLLPSKTAYENIAFAMEAAGKTDEDINENVSQVLEVVGLSDKSWHFPHELSGGEKQRVAIARAIVNQPDLIIADEPTGNLDPLNTREVIEILKKINEIGTTVLMATHNKDVVNSLGKRVVTIEKGKIIRDDKGGRYVI